MENTDAITDGLTIVLNNNKADADGKSYITAVAQYADGGFWQSNVSISFVLSSASKARFVDGASQSVVGYTDAKGNVSQSFYDTVTESGTINAYVTNNPTKSDTKQFTFTGEVMVKLLDLINNGTTAQEGNTITAIAQVTLNESPYDGKTVKFELQDSAITNARFTDTNTVNTEGISDNGKVTRTFYDKVAEVGQIYVYITLDTGRTSDDLKDFEFKAKSQSNLMFGPLNNNGAIAASGTAITANVIFTQDGQTKEGQEVYFILRPEGDITAQFEDTKTQNTQATTNNNGIASVAFTDVIWEEGTILAYVMLDGGEKVSAEQDFEFGVPPSLKVQLQPLTAVVPIGVPGVPTTVQLDSLPANGRQLFGATALVTTEDASGNDSPWPYGANVEFNLVGSNGSTSSLFTNQTTFYDGSISTNKNTSLGTLKAEFNDFSIENGLIAARVLAYSNSPKLENTMPFSFVDPWSSISAVSVGFLGNYDKANIFANGLNQARIIVKLTLSDGQSTLTKTNRPSFDDVVKNIVLIDYDNPSYGALGQGELAQWAYTRTANEFDKEQMLFNTSMSLDGNNDPLDNYDGGIITIVYYVTCKPSNSLNDIRFGLQITPTGFVPSQSLVDGKGTLQRAKTLIYSTYSGLFSNSPATLKVLKALDYTAINALETTYQPDNHQGSNDSQLVNTVGMENQNNYYRVLNYTLGVSQDRYIKYGARLKYAQFTEPCTISDDFSFAENSYTIYNYKAYFWPTNVRSSDGVALNVPASCSLLSDGCESRAFAIPDSSDYLHFTLYCTFGNLKCGYKQYSSFAVKIYDNYGNSGLYYIDGSIIPVTYFLATNGSWSIIQTSKPPEDSLQTGNNAGPVRIMNFGMQSLLMVNSNKDYKKAFGYNPLGVDKTSIDLSIVCNNPTALNYIKSYYMMQSSGLRIWYQNEILKNPLLDNPSSGTGMSWFFKPIWDEDAIVIAFADDATNNYYSWYTAVVTHDNGDTDNLVYVSPYMASSTKYIWQFYYN